MTKQMINYVTVPEFDKDFKTLSKNSELWKKISDI